MGIAEKGAVELVSVDLLENLLEAYLAKAILGCDGSVYSAPAEAEPASHQRNRRSRAS